MASFRYKVQQNGSAQVGTIEAGSLQEASAVLRRQGGVILQLRADTAAKRSPAPHRASSPTASSSSSTSSLRSVANRVLIFRSQMELTLRQLGSLLGAGVPRRSAEAIR